MQNERTGRSKPGVFWILLLWLLLGSSLGAQAQLTYRNDVQHVYDLLQRGQFDAVVAATSDVMNRWNISPPNLLYARGYAAFRLCWFDVAKENLKSLGEYKLGEGWQPANELLKTMEALYSLCPKHRHDIRSAGQLTFRVYCDQDIEWTQAILDLLPQAFKNDFDLLGIKVYGTSVFVFTDSKRYEEFARLLFGVKLHSWEWANGSCGNLMFCSMGVTGQKFGVDYHSDYFRSSVAHEFTHALLHRVLGAAAVPTWLDEGLADVAGSRLAPKQLAENDKDMQACLADADSVLPLDKLKDSKLFFELVETQYAQQKGKEYSGPRPYEQSFHMVRYLVAHSRKQALSSFLALYQQNTDIEKAFKEAFGVSTADFYAAWLRDSTNAGRSQ